MLKLVLALAVIVALAGCSMAVAADNQAAIDSKSYEQRVSESDLILEERGKFFSKY